MTRTWLVVAVACALTACVRTTDGTPVAADTVAPAVAAPSTSVVPSTAGDPVDPGIVPTTRTPVPAGTVCDPAQRPPVGVLASVTDPAAPKITVALPTGWSTTKGDGDVGARLAGPDGVSATVTITQTRLDAAAAFRKYTDDAMATSPISSVSVMPADLCGYSGQKLLGSWAHGPAKAVAFGDRLAHIWTSTNDYLVAVHVEGPADAPGFDPFTSPLMDDFTIVIP
jgi:hypothetical protein